MSFEPEDFWYIKLVITKERDGRKIECEFKWQRDRLFDESAVEILLQNCMDESNATVKSVDRKPAKKWRPQPLNTVEAQKLISRKLRISPAASMDTMEKLYNQGYLSYPRTETNKYQRSINLKALVEKQQTGPWHEHVNEMLHG